jgi:parallel beta-helix repeat protein
MRKARKLFGKVTAKNLVTVLVLVVVVLASFQVQAGLIHAVPNAGQTATASGAFAQMEPCDYLVFTDGTTTYGKNCDTGSIDFSGMAATVINDALSSALNVFVDPGTYMITSTITEGSTQSLSGSGWGTILEAGPGLNAPVVALSGGSLFNMEVNGNGAAQSGGTSEGNVYVTGSAVTVQNVWVQNSYWRGIMVNGGMSDNVLNNLITNAGERAILIQNSAQNMVEGNTIMNVMIGITLYGEGSYGNLVGFNQIVPLNPSTYSTTQTGIDVESDSRNNTVSNNDVERTTHEGVWAQNSWGNIVTGNHVSSDLDDYGMSFTNASYTVISNNIIASVFQDGIMLVANSPPSNYCTITGNIIQNANSNNSPYYPTGGTYQSGIADVDGLYDVISNNIIVDSRSPVLVRTGIVTYGSADYVTIIGNVVIGPPTQVSAVGTHNTVSLNS